MRNEKAGRDGTSKAEHQGDGVRFLKTWFEKPLLLGAVSPSGPVLAQAIAGYVDPAMPGPIIELGPGTGTVTAALLARGIAPSRLVLIEFEPNFCVLLRARFPGVRVIEGDAFGIKATLEHQLEAPAAAVVSSLPLLMRPESVRLSLLSDAFDLMLPASPFVQFTYASSSPMPLKGPFTFEAQASSRIWRNMPPARIWVYRRLVQPQFERARHH